MSEQDSSPPEGFRVIPGYPRYAINESGTILSVRGKNKLWEKALRIKPGTGSDGYHIVNLCHDCHKRTITVHKLMLLTFVSSCPDGMQCRHLDGNKTNNHVSNLKWGTRSENENDKILHGTSNQGEKHWNTKLTKEDVLEIRARAASGERYVDIAKDFPVTDTTISCIVQRLAWKHI